jgi:hypothetical protein
MAENNTPQVEVPPLLVQRMGKKWRIVYKENRNLAKFNSGEPVDDGGFKTQEEAMIHMSKVTSGFKTSDPEEENVA